jgi:hypothetical protein
MNQLHLCWMIMGRTGDTWYHTWKVRIYGCGFEEFWYLVLADLILCSRFCQTKKYFAILIILLIIIVALPMLYILLFQSRAPNIVITDTEYIPLSLIHFRMFLLNSINFTTHYLGRYFQ